MLSRPWYGSCERLSSALHLMGIRVTYRLRTKWDQVNYGAKKGADYAIADLAVAIRQQMYQDLGLLQCNRCHADIFRSNQDNSVEAAKLPQFFDFIAYFSTHGGTCGEVGIVDAMSKIIGRELIVNVDGDKHVTFEIEEIETYDSFEPQENMSQVAAPLSEDAACLAKMYLNYRDLNRCPMVKLGRTHYPSLKSLADTEAKKGLVNSLFGVEAGQEGLVVEQNVTSVCWEDYRKIYARLTNTSMKPSAKTFVNVLAMFNIFRCM